MIEHSEWCLRMTLAVLLERAQRFVDCENKLNELGISIDENDTLNIAEIVYTVLDEIWDESIKEQDYNWDKIFDFIYEGEGNFEEIIDFIIAKANE